MAERLLGAGPVCALSALLLGSAVGGCSWTFVDAPPPEVPEGQLPECTESQAAPIADAVFAALGAAAVVAGAGLMGAVLGADTSGEDYLRDGIGLGVGLPLIIGGVATLISFAVSADDGFTDTAACTEARVHGLHGPRTPRSRGPHDVLSSPCGDCASFECTDDPQCVPAGCVEDAHEDNDDRAAATPFTSVGPAEYLAVRPRDADYWAIDVCLGASLQIVVRFVPWAGDADVYLYDQAGRLLAHPSDAGEGRRIEWVSDREGPVYADVDAVPPPPEPAAAPAAEPPEEAVRAGCLRGVGGHSVPSDPPINPSGCGRRCA